jgi:hypothetical protein
MTYSERSDTYKYSVVGIGLSLLRCDVKHSTGFVKHRKTRPERSLTACDLLRRA